jgi:hypothetical protein
MLALANITDIDPKPWAEAFNTLGFKALVLVCATFVVVTLLKVIGQAIATKNKTKKNEEG